MQPIQKGVRVRQVMPKPFEGHVADFGIDREKGERLFIVREPIYEDDGTTPKMVEDRHYDLVQERDKKGALVFDADNKPVWTETRVNERVDMVPAFHEAVFKEGEIEVVDEE